MDTSRNGEPTKHLKKYHPDVNDAANAGAFFRQMQDAYETLNVPKKRKAYDNPKSEYAENVGYQTDTEDDSNLYHDGYTYEVLTQEPKRNIVLFIALIPIKIIALVLIPIVAFLKQICLWLTVAVALISRLFMGFCIFVAIVVVFQNMPPQAKIGLVIIYLIGAFLGYCLSYIVSVAPTALTLLKGCLKKFVFGHTSEFDEA